MLTLKQIREERQRTVERLAVKGVDAAPVIEKIIAEDDLRRSLQQRLDGCLAEQNALSKEIGKLFAAGRREEADAAKGRVTLLKEESKTLEEQLREAADRMNALIVTLPNVRRAGAPKRTKWSKSRRCPRHCPKGRFHTGNWRANTALSISSWA